MSRVNELKKFIKHDTQRRWTDEQILALTPKLRSELASYAEKDGKPVRRIHPELQELIAERGFTPADGRAAMTLMQDKTINPMIQSNAEWILSKGGNEIFTESESTLYMCNGDKVVRPLTPIPTNPSVPDRYPNLDVLTAFLGTLVSHKDGVWSNAMEQAWVKTFPTLGAAGVNALANFLSEILNTDDSWKSMPLTMKASMTGRNGAVFIRNVLNNLPREVYNYLNTKTVIEGMRALSKSDTGDWEYNMSEDGKFIVPEKVYEVRPHTKQDAAFSEEFPATFIYKGGWVPAARLPKVDPTSTASILAAKQKAVDVARGDSCIPSLIAKSQGFSGMTPEGAKILYFIISSTLECWRRGRVVDIRLTRDGDIVPLYCVLSYWKKQIIDNEFADFSLMTERGPWFFFLTAKRNSHLNVAVDIKELIVPAHNAKSVAIAFLDDSIKTKVDKNSDPVNHDLMSACVLPKDLPEEYVVKCPIYGTAFFPRDEVLIRNRQKGTKQEEFESHYRNVHVFGHGNASDFFGIATTFQDFKLVGATPGKKTLELVSIELECYSTREAWYRKVSSDINAIYQAVFNPKKTFSTISNLLVITKSKVSILSDLNGGSNPVGYSGKVFSKTETARKKFVLPGAEKPETTSGVPTTITTQAPAVKDDAPVMQSTKEPPKQVWRPKAFQAPPKEEEKAPALVDEPSQSSDSDDEGDGDQDEEGEEGESNEPDSAEDGNMVNLNDD